MYSKEAFMLYFSFSYPLYFIILLKLLILISLNLESLVVTKISFLLANSTLVILDPPEYFPFLFLQSTSVM